MPVPDAITLLVSTKGRNTTPSDLTLKKARLDNVVSISVGGLITLAILATAAAVMFAQGLEATSHRHEGREVP